MHLEFYFTLFSSAQFVALSESQRNTFKSLLMFLSSWKKIKGEENNDVNFNATL